jgi:hypothetical protein
VSERPVISVAIPLFNQADYVAEAVASVLAQSFGDLEVIVIDDGSTDEGPRHVRAFNDPRIRVESQANAGVSEARTRALREARAELIAFQDADDVWAPDHLRHLVESSSRYPQAVLFGNRFVEFERKLPVVTAQPIEYRLLDDYFAACAFEAQPFFTSSCMVRREAALASGGFASGHARGEDLALWIKLAATAPVAVTNYTGCYYRRSRSGLTSRPVLTPDISMQTLQHLLVTQPEWPATRRHSVAEYYNRVALAHALDCLRAGETDAADKFCDLAAGTRAFRTRWWLAKFLQRTPQFARDLAFRVLSRRSGRTP